MPPDRLEGDPGAEGTCADAVAELLDALAVGRVGVLAQSLGAPFALAFAHCHPDRVHHLGLVGPIGPLDRPGARAGVDRFTRTVFTLARRAPLLLEGLFRLLRRRVQRDPERAAERFAGEGIAVPTTIWAAGTDTVHPPRWHATSLGASRRHGWCSSPTGACSTSSSAARRACARSHHPARRQSHERSPHSAAASEPGPPVREPRRKRPPPMQWL